MRSLKGRKTDATWAEYYCTLRRADVRGRPRSDERSGWRCESAAFTLDLRAALELSNDPLRLPCGRVGCLLSISTALRTKNRQIRLMLLFVGWQAGR